MATKDAIKISNAYAVLESVCDSAGYGAQGLLLKAYSAALDGERAHRRMGRGLSAYRMSAETCAKAFVLKWLCSDDVKPLTGWQDAANTRLDVLYSRALRENLESRPAFSAFARAAFKDSWRPCDWDYSRDAVKGVV